MGYFELVNDEKASLAISYRSDDKMPGLYGLTSLFSTISYQLATLSFDVVLENTISTQVAFHGAFEAVLHVFCQIR